jgi:acetyltransferase-like isoleucine patch superfamily enzyme
MPDHYDPGMGSDGGPALVAPGAVIEPGASVGAGTAVWDLAVVRRDARVGADCIIGRGAFIDAGVMVGDRCKIQNNALIYAPAVLADGVFVGPAVVITNDRRPRAIRPDGGRKAAVDWQADGVTIGHGASIGAGAVVVAGVTVGPWALVGAGATVVSDVAAHALVVGSPARRVGWVDRWGERLTQGPDGLWRGPGSDESFVERQGVLELRP